MTNPLPPAPRIEGYSGARVVVLGAAGFIGRWLSRALTRSGADLVMVVRDPDAARPLLDRWEADGALWPARLEERGAVDALIARAAPDIVFNLAGYGVDRTERDDALAQALNADLPAAAAEACAALPPTDWTGVRLLHIGSALEYGIVGGVLEEGSPVQPTTLYGRSKLAGTERIRQIATSHGLPAVIARLFTVFGPGEHDGRLLPTLVQAATTGAAVPLSDGRQRRDFVFVGDLADALLRLALAPGEPGESVNVATGEMRSVRDFAVAAAAALGMPAERLDFGAVAVRLEEMSHDGVSVRRFAALTGHPLLPDLEGSLVRAVAAGIALGEYRPRSVVPGR